MRLIFILFSFLFLISCGSDDNNSPEGDPYNFEMEVTVSNITLHKATITWNEPLQSEWGSVVYKIILNNEVIADGLQSTNYTISELNDNRAYSGTVYATGINGDETFAHFTFTTLPNTVINGTVTLTTQEQVNNFYYTYVAILIINGNDITDLSPMSSIQHVSNKLVIENTSVINLNGLENLNSGYDSNITIIENQYLEDIGGLSAYFPLSEFIQLKNNRNLININNVSVGEDANVSIHNCPVTTLPDLSAGSYGWFYLINTEIENLQSFASVTSLYGISLVDNSRLSSLEGMNNIQQLYALYIRNSLITNLDSFQSLTNSPSPYNLIEIGINENPNLTNFCGLTNWKLNSTIYDECINPDCSETIYHYQISDNAYNPTEIQMESTTECSI